MVYGLNFKKAGDPIDVTKIELPQMGEKSVHIANNYFAVTRFDVDQQKGAQPFVAKQQGLGFVSVGTVLQVGNSVTSYEKGDKVLCFNQAGSVHQTEFIASEATLLKLEEKADYKLIGACAFNLLVAHCLVRRVFALQPGHGVLLSNASGQISKYIATIADFIGAYVFGLVRDDAQAKLAEKAKCHKVFKYDENWVEGILNLTSGYGLNVAYNSLGESFHENLYDALIPINMVVNYGSITGDIINLPMQKIKNKSSFVTFPSIIEYKKNRHELLLTMEDILGLLKNGAIKPIIEAEYRFSEIDKAYEHVLNSKQHDCVLVKC